MERAGGRARRADAGSGGVWLESIPDAAKAYEGLFTADGLKSARKNRAFSQHGTPALLQLIYQLAGQGQRPHRALILVNPLAARDWLEKKLGPLVHFEVVGRERRGGQAQERSWR